MGTAEGAEGAEWISTRSPAGTGRVDGVGRVDQHRGIPISPDAARLHGLHMTASTHTQTGVGQWEGVFTVLTAKQSLHTCSGLIPKYECCSSRASVRAWVSSEVMMAKGRGRLLPDRNYVQGVDCKWAVRCHGCVSWMTQVGTSESYITGTSSVPHVYITSGRDSASGFYLQRQDVLDVVLKEWGPGGTLGGQGDFDACANTSGRAGGMGGRRTMRSRHAR